MPQDIESQNRRSRGFIIAEAAVEYFIALCVTSTFLTAILNHMEVSSAHQGVIASISQLACGVQLLAVFGVRRTYPCRRWVSILNLVNQLLFALLYLVPLTPLPQAVKLAAFVVMLLCAYFCQHYLTPSRTQWHMSLVDDHHRGIFTANKEIISLVGGMIFSQSAGILFDHLKAAGRTEAAFVVFAAAITIMAIGHFALMLAIRELEPPHAVPPKRFGEIVRTVFGDRQLRTVIVFDALFSITLVPAHFSAVYLTRTIGFSYTVVTLFSVVQAAVRAVASRPLGRYADGRSWVSMLRLCMTVSAAGCLFYAFCTPATPLFYALYTVCHAFSLGGTNSGRTNLCFDYVAPDDRRYVLGVKAAISGIVNFIVTLLAARVVDAIEANGNAVFGVAVYPQQVLFAANAVLLGALVLWFLPRLRKKD